MHGGHTRRLMLNILYACTSDHHRFEYAQYHWYPMPRTPHQRSHKAPSLPMILLTIVELYSVGVALWTCFVCHVCAAEPPQ